MRVPAWRQWISYHESVFSSYTAFPCLWVCIHTFFTLLAFSTNTSILQFFFMTSIAMSSGAMHLFIHASWIVISVVVISSLYLCHIMFLMILFSYRTLPHICFSIPILFLSTVHAVYYCFILLIAHSLALSCDTFLSISHIYHYLHLSFSLLYVFLSHILCEFGWVISNVMYLFLPI